MTPVSTWGAIAFGYHIASRLAYVLGVGGMLRGEERRGAFSRRYGIEPGWLRFRRIASLIMNNDGVSFVVLCLVTGGTLGTGLPRSAELAGGALLSATGVGIKLWAAARLGGKAYYWHNFFDPSDSIVVDPPGPYRYFRNPMYTLGYLQTYGLALMFGSLPALVAGAFDQAAILAFYHVVEKPHFAALRRRKGSPVPAEEAVR